MFEEYGQTVATAQFQSVKTKTLTFTCNSALSTSHWDRSISNRAHSVCKKCKIPGIEYCGLWPWSSCCCLVTIPMPLEIGPNCPLCWELRPSSIIFYMAAITVLLQRALGHGLTSSLNSPRSRFPSFHNCPRNRRQTHSNPWRIQQQFHLSMEQMLNVINISVPDVCRMAISKELHGAEVKSINSEESSD